MDYRNALKWTLLYRGIVTISFVLGAGLAIGGLLVGIDFSLSALQDDPLNPQRAIGLGSPFGMVAMIGLGVLVCQIGKSFALHLTIPPAAADETTKDVNTERVKSEILETLDHRLSEMHDEIEETRRGVQELKRAEHAAEFDEDDIPEPASSSSSVSGSSSVSESPSRSTANSSTSSTAGSTSTTPSSQSTTAASVSRSSADSSTGEGGSGQSSSESSNGAADDERRDGGGSRTT